MIAIQEAQAAAPATMRFHFASGMPGLEEYRRYTLVALEDSPAFWLECDDEPGIILPVADAFAVVPDYSFEIGAADVRALDLADESEALVLTVLTLPQSDGPITVNLLAPIVANRRTGAARQLILEGSGHSLRHELNVNDEG